MLIKFYDSVTLAINTERVESVSEAKELDVVEVRMFSGDVFILTNDQAKRLLNG